MSPAQDQGRSLLLLDMHCKGHSECRSLHDELKTRRSWKADKRSAMRIGRRADAAISTASRVLATAISSSSAYRLAAPTLRLRKRRNLRLRGNLAESPTRRQIMPLMLLLSRTAVRQCPLRHRLLSRAMRCHFATSSVVLSRQARHKTASLAT